MSNFKTFIFLTLAIISTATALEFSIMDDSNPFEDKYFFCACANDGHAFVTLVDASNGDPKVYARGLYSAGYGTGLNGAKVPQAGEPALPDSQGVKAPVTDATLGDKTKDASASTSGAVSGVAGSTVTSGQVQSGGDVKIAVRESLGKRGTIQDDRSKISGSTKCVCFAISKEKYNAAVAAINNYEHAYRLLSQNCVDFVENIADAAGVNKLPSATDFLVSYPPTFRRSMNYWLWSQATQDYDHNVIVAENYTELKKLFNNTFNKSIILPWEGRYKLSKTDQQIEEHAVGLLGTPDLVYTSLVQEGAKPQEVKITTSQEAVTSTGNSESKCTDCFNENTGINFRLLGPMPRYYYVWWDFGDGTKIIGNPSPTHAYKNKGVYHVKMRYFDEDKNVKFGERVLLIGMPVQKTQLQVKPVVKIKPRATIKSENKNYDDANKEQLRNERTITTPETSIPLTTPQDTDKRRATSKVYTLPSGTSFEVTPIENIEESQITNKAKNLIDSVQILGNDLILINVLRKDGSITIAKLKTTNGKFNALYVLGQTKTRTASSELTQASKLTSENEEIQFTGVITLDEETLATIANSLNSKEEFKKAWGKQIIFRPVTIENSIKGALADIAIKLNLV